jgi:hypothetical protein
VGLAVSVGESLCLQERWKSRSRLRGLRWEGVVEDRRLCRLVNLGCKSWECELTRTYFFRMRYK